MRKIFNLLLIALTLMTCLMVGIRTEVVSVNTYNQDSFGNWYFNYVEGSEVTKANFSLNSYYSSLEGISNATTFKSTLQSIINQGFHALTYKYSGATGSALRIIDEYPGNSSKVICIYGGNAISNEFNASVWNQEHLWPQAHGISGDSKSDLVHLHASGSSINSKRGNLDFGEIKTSTYNHDSYGNKWTSQLFEPQDCKKGDVARSILYMVIKYPNLNLVDTTTSTQTSNLGIKSVLLRWHAEDPVDDLERRRNDRVYNAQGNRNPFIDHPEYANLLFGAEYPTGDQRATVSYQVASDVTFNYSDSTAYPINSLIEEPDVIPTKFGYQFVGWYKDKNLTKAWNFQSDKITANLVLYPKFELVSSTDQLFKNLKMEVALGINYSAGDLTELAVTKSFKPTSGNGVLAISGSSPLDITDYLDIDKDVFTVSYLANGALSQAYVKDGEIRLYSKGGNGSSLIINSNLEIENIEVTSSDVSNIRVTISSNSKQAEIKNVAASTSGNIKVTALKITYLVPGNETVVLEDVALLARLKLTKEFFELADVEKIEFYVDSEKVTTKYSEDDNFHYLLININTSDYDHLYKIEAKYLEETIKLEYSAVKLAHKYLNSYPELVKEYKNIIKAIGE